MLYTNIGESADAPGTGNVDLASGGPLDGMKAFDDAYGSIETPATNVRVRYKIVDQADATKYERGRGLYTKSGSDKTLVRSKVYESSVVNSTVDFDGPVNVFISADALSYGPQVGSQMAALTTGTSTAYVAVMKPPLPEYNDNDIYLVEFHTACGSAPVLDLGPGSKNIADTLLTNLTTGAISTNQRLLLTYRSASDKLLVIGTLNTFGQTIFANAATSITAAGRIEALTLRVGGTGAPTGGSLGEFKTSSASEVSVGITNTHATAPALLRFGMTGRTKWIGVQSGMFQIFDDTALAGDLTIDGSGNLTLSRGELTLPSNKALIAGNANHYLKFDGTNVIHNVDANDYWWYDRANNTFVWVIGGVAVAQINASGFVGMPLRKVHTNTNNVASAQASGLAALLSNDPWYTFFSGRARFTGGGLGSFTIRTLDSGGTVLASVATASSVNNISFFGYCAPAFGTIAKDMRVWVTAGGAAEDLTTGGTGNLNAVDQLQVIGAANVDATFAMWGARD